MILRRNLGKRMVAAVICLVMFSTISPSVFAAESHEDPETAKVVFSGVSLLKYYSDSLDFVVRVNPEEVQARLEKMPFASVPQSMEEATGTFTANVISISYLVVELDEGQRKLGALVEQFRTDEATGQATQASANLSLADEALKQIAQATETIGEELGISSALAGSDLKLSYTETVERIDRIRRLLALYRGLIEEILESSEELLDRAAIGTSIKSTDITLEITPVVAFVGDSISVDGVLTSEESALEGREVDILLNGFRYITVKTDAYGRYQGMLPIPYWYRPEIVLRALYYPQDEDIGLYLASASPRVNLQVLFHTADLEVTIEDKVYPGMKTMVSGMFDYPFSQPLNERMVEIYFGGALLRPSEIREETYSEGNDGTVPGAVLLEETYGEGKDGTVPGAVLLTEFMAQEVFAQEIKIDAETDAGEHIITVSAVAAGRYASIVTSAILDVTMATPILDINIPKVILMPGSVGLEGKLYSEVSPLSGALIKMELGKSKVELTSSEGGDFNTRIKMGIGFGLIGWQDLAIQIIPQEPWHAPLNSTSRVLMINVINLSGIIVVLVFLGIYLPVWLRRRLAAHSKGTTGPAIAPPLPKLSPAYRDSVSVPVSTEESEPDGREPQSIIFYWYRWVLRLIQATTKVLLKPQQTLREFAEESSRLLGPAAKYFIELTKMIERSLYSQYRPTEMDAENSRQLSLKVEEESKPEVGTLPLDEEGKQAQFDADDRISVTNRWRQLSTWLRVLWGKNR